MKPRNKRATEQHIAVKDTKRDRPLGFHWRVSQEAISALHLPPARNDKFEAARNAILSEAFLAAEEDKRVSFSRSRAFYAGRPPRYYGTAYSYLTVTGSIAELCPPGWIDEWRAAPGSRGWQSTFGATNALMEAWGSGNISLTPIDRECIRLRDADGNPMDYVDTSRTRRMRRDLDAINGDLQTITVDIDADDVIKRNTLWTVRAENGPACIRPRSPYLYRIFSRGSFSLGGRAYGWWQSIPRTHRPLLTINGEPVVECDYAALHPRLLYAERNLPLDGDPYTTDEFTREQGKYCFNIGLNAATPRAWLGALANKVGSRALAAKLIDVFKAKRKAIADVFGRDFGIRLMRLDSDLILSALTQCLKDGIAALSVHDSLLVPARYADRAEEIMLAAFAKAVGPSPCAVVILQTNFEKYGVNNGWIGVRTTALLRTRDSRSLSLS